MSRMGFFFVFFFNKTLHVMSLETSAGQDTTTQKLFISRVLSAWTRCKRRVDAVDAVGDGVSEKSRAQQNFVGKNMRYDMEKDELRFHVISFLGEFLPQKHLQQSDVMYRFLVHCSRKHSMTIPDLPWEWYNLPTCFR